jgi:putative tricarboxylic transport membrane protein
MRKPFADADGLADLVLVAAMWIVAATVYASASRMPPPIFDPVGSAAMPKSVALVIAVLAAMILVQRLRRQPPAGAAEEGQADLAPLRTGTALACIAIMVGYTGVMSYGILGFREATVPFVILLGGVMSRFRRSTLLILVPSALAIAIGFGWLFSEVLFVDLPVTKWLAP